MQLFHVPIEPYETRYTADWIEQYETEFKNNNIQFKTILGKQTTSKLKEGTVLDCCGTNIYKSSQMISLLELINNGEVKDDDIIFFADMWFPGLEALFYVRDLSKIKFKIYGILHAGTWDSYDFTALNGLGVWAKSIEHSWIHNVDGVFVATHSHKNMIEQYFNEHIDKIHVTGIPFYYKSLEKYLSPKEDIIVFPHREAIEKQPDLFNQLSQLPSLKKFKFLKSMDVTKNRQEYFKLLGKSKYMVSFANQETFGYSTVESMALHCHVIVPNHLSYKETVPECDRYNTQIDWVRPYDGIHEWVSRVENLVLFYEKNYKEPDYSSYLDKWQYAIKNMLDIMRA